MKYKTLLAVTMPLWMLLFFCTASYCQVDSMQTVKKSTGKNYKNVIRYNISNPLFFGFDKYVILGYERIVNARQSFSINVGAAAFPDFIALSTDSFHLQKEAKNNGYNASIDYRFYLSKENKYAPPHGVYIGPYVSYNHFERENDWAFQRSGSNQELITTDINFNIFTAGVELGYQFVFWKRVTLDMVLVGPGLSSYNLKAKSSEQLTGGQQENLNAALIQLLSQKFPGMNYVLSDKELNANGSLGTWALGYRYLISIGFRL